MRYKATLPVDAQVGLLAYALRYCSRRTDSECLSSRRHDCIELLVMKESRAVLE